MARFIVDTGPDLDALLSLAELRRYLVADPLHDDLITDLRAAAHTFAESYCSNHWGARTGFVYLDQLRGAIDLCAVKRPVTQVTAFVYHDADDQEQTLTDGVDYRFDPVTGMLDPISGWPSLSDRRSPVKLSVSVGHEAAPADVLLAIKLHCLGTWDDIDQGEAIRAHLEASVYRW